MDREEEKDSGNRLGYHGEKVRIRAVDVMEGELGGVHAHGGTPGCEEVGICFQRNPFGAGGGGCHCEMISMGPEVAE